MENMKITVLLCTRNRLDDINRCLLSLSRQTLLPDQIVVVDSSDNRLDINALFKQQFHENFFPHINLLYVHTKPELTYQRNRGIEKAVGDIIYFFDDDVVLENDYLFQMNSIFNTNPHYAAGMGDIINIDPHPSWKYQLFRKFFLLPRQRSSGLFTWSGMPTHPYGCKEFKEVEVLGGCCMAFRRGVLERHTFDENFTGYAYMEDCDIARRISFESKIFFNPKARLQHLESPLARDKVLQNSAMFIRNYRYLFFKNIYPTSNISILGYYWSITGLFLESLIIKDWQKMKGYLQGLRHQIIDRR